jgi:hypothetical protein
MAEPLTISLLRAALRTPTQSGIDPFTILKSVSAIVNTDDGSDAAREMVLRALDQQAFFEPYQQILDALARAVGLFPYINPDSLDLKDSIAYEFHRPLNMPPELVFHREQAKIYQRLLAGDSVVLSAPTSFGKSKIIDAMIASKRFENIAIIVPTLALIDETRRRLTALSKEYKVVTHLSQPPGKKNILVLTAERAVAYEKMPKIDFFVIDEFYKLDPGDRDDARAVALSQAFYKLIKGGAQFYLLGPNIDRVPQNVERAYGCFFYQTGFATVVSEQTRVRDKGDEIDRLVNLAAGLEEPTLIFCSSPARVNLVARTFAERGLGVDVPAMQPCADWAGHTHHPDWTFCKAIVRGIGIHHGRLPRALAQYVVRSFNEGKLRYLICTSTLIEGVNTKAKNVIIFDNKIARQKIDYFTFNNIKGRSGRMGQHFVGHVYLFHEPPQQSLPFVDFPTLTQPKTTPTSLLIQMDEEDLQPDSQKRIREYLDGSELPLAIVRQNAGIDPAHQVELARYIRTNSQRLWRSLNWTSVPTSDQFKMTCELIWKFLIRTDRRQYGVSSGDQLSFKTFQLMFNSSVLDRVLKELSPGKYAAATPDEAVERVLEFDRNWAGFELPRLLMTLSRIQDHVLTDEGLPHGDYSSFSGRVECLFTTPVVAALDEYGIPIQLGIRLQQVLGTDDDLDRALDVVANIDVAEIKGINDFERDLLSYAQAAL